MTLLIDNDTSRKGHLRRWCESNVSHEPDGYLQDTFLMSVDKSPEAAGFLWTDIWKIQRKERMCMDKDEMSRVLRAVVWKKYRRYDSAAEYYEICESTFIRMAKDSKSVFKLGKISYVNCERFERYLETYDTYNY